jgi:hypothetical protein
VQQHIVGLAMWFGLQRAHTEAVAYQVPLVT